MDKRGEATQFSLEMFLKIMGLTLVGLIALQLLVGYYSSYELETGELRAKTLTSRIMYSHAINYVEDGRSYTGIIDMDKFNTESIEEAINYTSEYTAAAKLSLMHETGEVFDEAYINERRYEIWAPMAKAEIQESAQLDTTLIPVTVRDEKDRRAFLLIEVVTPQ